MLFIIILFVILFFIFKSSYQFHKEMKRNWVQPIVHTKYKKTSLFPEDFVVVDTETTGLDPACHKILQLSAIKYEGGVEVERFDHYLNPSMIIPQKVTEIHGINNLKVKKAPHPQEILPSFLEFIGDYPLVAHNASFDLKFIQTSLVTYGFAPLENKVIDTLALARTYFNTSNHKLTTLKKRLKLDADSHNAIEDCYVTGEVYLYCKAKYEVTKAKEEAKKQKQFEKDNNLPSQLELNCFKVIDEVLAEAHKNISLLAYTKSSSYFDITLLKNLFCRIKVSSKNQYILLEKDLLDLFEHQLYTMPATKSEGLSKVRVLFNTADDLNELKAHFNHLFEQLTSR